jgi:hypothetical protein
MMEGTFTNKQSEPITVESLERTVEAFHREYPEASFYQFIPVAYSPFWRLLLVLGVNEERMRWKR